MASLGNDLAQIRKKRNLTLDDLQEATKIPKRILRSIEDESIFSDFEENPTYIRSYIRGYAKALSIDDKQIIYALDQWEIGAYDGSLLELEGIEPSDEEDKPGEDSEQDNQPSSDESDDMIHDHSPAFQFEGDEDSEAVSKSSYKSPRSSEKSDIHSVNWAKMGKQFTPLQSNRSRTWLAVIIVLVIGLGGFFFFYFNSDSEQVAESQNNNQEQETEAALSTDSLELNFTPSPTEDTTPQTSSEEVDASSSIQSKMLDALPDTLDMIVYAAYGRLEPVRVYTDIMGDINPYWIEEGEAVRFDFVNEIRIRGQHDNIVLIMNGHVIEDFREQFYNPETRLVEINRSYFEEDPKWLQPAPDSLGIDAPAPSVIRERPTFN